jgi:hypothetical protein
MRQAWRDAHPEGSLGNPVYRPSSLAGLKHSCHRDGMHCRRPFGGLSALLARSSYAWPVGSSKVRPLFRGDENPEGVRRGLAAYIRDLPRATKSQRVAAGCWRGRAAGLTGDGGAGAEQLHVAQRRAARLSRSKRRGHAPQGFRCGSRDLKTTSRM